MPRSHLEKMAPEYPYSRSAARICLIFMERRTPPQVGTIPSTGWFCPANETVFDESAPFLTPAHAQFR
jgi:hypothetical protein